MKAANLPALLDARRMVSVAEYEAVEKTRAAVIDSGDYATDLGALADWYDQHYKDKGLLVFRGMQEYYRQYAWS